MFFTRFIIIYHQKFIKKFPTNTTCWHNSINQEWRNVNDDRVEKMLTSSGKMRHVLCGVMYVCVWYVFFLRHKNNMMRSQIDMYTQHIKHTMMKLSHFFLHFIFVNIITLKRDERRKNGLRARQIGRSDDFFSSLVSKYLFAHNIENWHSMSHWNGVMSLYYNFSLFFWAINFFASWCWDIEHIVNVIYVQSVIKIAEPIHSGCLNQEENYVVKFQVNKPSLIKLYCLVFFCSFWRQ